MAIKLTRRAARIMPEIASWYSHGWSDDHLIACGYAISTNRMIVQQSSEYAAKTRSAIHSQGGQRAKDIECVAKAQRGVPDEFNLIAVDEAEHVLGEQSMADRVKQKLEASGCMVRVNVGNPKSYDPHFDAELLGAVKPTGDGEERPSTDELLHEAGATLAALCHAAAARSGWWKVDGVDVRTWPMPMLNLWIGTKLALVHSEVSEALEGLRKNADDDHLKHRKAFEVEIADAFIRLADLAGGLGLDVGGAIAEKVAYNGQRADHKPENRSTDGGKEF